MAIESGKVKTFQELSVWQKAVQLCEDTYELIRQLPIEERFALASQLRRAVVSIPMNIAEGSRRNTSKEYYYFLGIAQGSLGEVITGLILCERLHKLEASSLINNCNEIGKMIRGLQKSILSEG